jgi:hypothetical protein
MIRKGFFFNDEECKLKVIGKNNKIIQKKIKIKKKIKKGE